MHRRQPFGYGFFVYGRDLFGNETVEPLFAPALAFGLESGLLPLFEGGLLGDLIYGDEPDVPREVLVPEIPDDPELHAAILTARVWIFGR